MKEPILFILLMFLSSGFAFGSQVSSTGNNTSEIICKSHNCVNAASRIIKMGNLSVDPCDDFYEFACGGLLNPTELETKSDKILQNILEQNIKTNDYKYMKLAKTLYRICTQQNYGEFVNSMELNGGWPVLKGYQWNKNKFNFNKTIFKVGNTTQWKNYFFDFISLVNYPSITLKPYSSELNAEDCVQGRNNTNVINYFNIMKMYPQLINPSEKNTNYTDDLEKLINFEIELCSARLSTAKEILDPTFDKVEMTLYKLQKTHPFFNWKEYINYYRDSPVNLSTTVIIKNYSYMKKLQDLLKSTGTKRTLANYVMWNYLKTYNKISLLSVNNQCVELVSSELPIAVGAIYVQNYNHSKIVNAEDNVSKMTLKIKEKFLEMIKQADWIDSKTQKNIIEKLQLFKNIIGSINELSNSSKVDEFYKDLELFDDETFFDGIGRISLFDSKKMLTYNKDNIWAYYVCFMKSDFAVSIPYLNSMVISYTLLESQFFDSEQPNYINYGAMGFLIGHEMIHGFNNEGKQYDAKGRLNNTWTSTSTNNFHKKSKCFIEQYGNYIIKELGLNLNGSISQGETVADNGGMRAAYRAYNKLSNTDKRLPGLFYTPKQMFWISYANTWCQKPTTEILKMYAVDVHPPQRFRVIGTLSNSPEFAKDFGCPSGSNMNPVKKCSVW